MPISRKRTKERKRKRSEPIPDATSTNLTTSGDEAPINPVLLKALHRLRARMYVDKVRQQRAKINPDRIRTSKYQAGHQGARERARRLSRMPLNATGAQPAFHAGVPGSSPGEG